MASSSSPKLLKDFLIDDTHSYPLNGFRSYPRKPSKSMVRKVPRVIQKRTNSTKTSSQLLRSRSKAATSTIFAIHKASEMVTKALKYLPFASIKPPSILPRSISRKLSKLKKENNEEKVLASKVKVKDILRWRSFRDLVEERSTPLDLRCSPHRCTTTTITTSSTSSRRSSDDDSSSWCGSDFTAEDFPSWCYENAVKMGKEYLHDEGVGEDLMKTRTINMDSKSNLLNDDEYEQHTPISVLDSPFGEDEESILDFNSNVSNINRRKCALMQPINEFEILSDPLEQIDLEHRFSTEKSNYSDGENEGEGEDVNEIEEKAYHMLCYLKDKTLVNNFDSNLDSDYLLFDFFKHELTRNKNQENDKCEREILRLGDDWLSGVYEGSYEWEVEEKRENYVREMENGLRWNKLDEEKEEMVLQLESLMMNSLVDELLIDLLVIV